MGTARFEGRASRWGAFALLAACAFLAACSVALDFDGLTGAVSDAGADGARDATSDAPLPPTDAGADASADASTEAAVDARADVSAPDANVDAGVDAGCPGTAGPSGVRIGTYCIDSTEVTNVQYEKFLAARAGDVSGQPAYCSWNTTFVPGDKWPYPAGNANVPVGNVDWCDAYAYCRYAGKRLCGNLAGGTNAFNSWADATQSAWFKACSHNNDGVHKYPYGNTYDSTACNSKENGTVSVPVATMARCVGGYPGIYDLSGNVGEWEDSCSASTGATDQCHTRGGSHYDIITGLNCDSNDSTDRSFSIDGTGFRCCSP